MWLWLLWGYIRVSFMLPGVSYWGAQMNNVKSYMMLTVIIGRYKHQHLTYCHPKKIRSHLWWNPLLSWSEILQQCSCIKNSLALVMTLQHSYMCVCIPCCILLMTVCWLLPLCFSRTYWSSQFWEHHGKVNFSWCWQHNGCILFIVSEFF